MATVRIYQPSKTAMPSGRGKIKNWRVQFETLDPLTREPLMGWVQSYDMCQELRLFFPSLAEAIHYAVSNGFAYTVCNPNQLMRVPKSYATNFTCPRMRGR